jgi:hypothetical protein
MRNPNPTKPSREAHADNRPTMEARITRSSRALRGVGMSRMTFAPGPPDGRRRSGAYPAPERGDERSMQTDLRSLDIRLTNRR